MCLGGLEDEGGLYPSCGLRVALTAAAYVWDGRQALRPHRCAAAARLERTLQRQVWLCAGMDECGRGRGMCGLTWGRQGLEALGRASFVWQEPTRATLVGVCCCLKPNLCDAMVGRGSVC